jgi:hypothetical protein
MASIEVPASEQDRQPTPPVVLKLDGKASLGVDACSYGRAAVRVLARRPTPGTPSKQPGRAGRVAPSHQSRHGRRIGQLGCSRHQAAVSTAPTRWLPLVRRSHDVSADPGDERFPNRTEAATNPMPSLRRSADRRPHDRFCASVGAQLASAMATTQSPAPRPACDRSATHASVSDDESGDRIRHLGGLRRTLEINGKHLLTFPGGGLMTALDRPAGRGPVGRAKRRGPRLVGLSAEAEAR